jgi:hypothetical protein
MKEVLDEILTSTVWREDFKLKHYKDLLNTTTRKLVLLLNEATRFKNGIFYTGHSYGDKGYVRRHVPDNKSMFGFITKNIIDITWEGLYHECDLHLPYGRKLNVKTNKSIANLIDKELNFNKSLKIDNINDLKLLTSNLGYTIGEIRKSCGDSYYIDLSKTGSQELEFTVRVSNHQLNDHNYLGCGVVNYFRVDPRNIIKQIPEIINHYEIFKSKYGDKLTNWVWSERSISDMEELESSDIEFDFTLIGTELVEKLLS